jgi:hypothetical protein
MSVRIDVEGDDDAALEDLWQWLSAERELRGGVRLESAPTVPGTMGGGTEIVVQVVGLVPAFVGMVLQSIDLWLTHRPATPRGSATTVTITTPDGTTFEISGERPAEVQQLVVAISGHLRDGDDDPAA